MTESQSTAPPKTAGPSVGEWEYDDGTGQVDVADGTICVGITWRPNGYLIAAAPDLLAALKQLTKGMNEDFDSTPRVFAVEVREARAAIAKAEGR